MSLRWLEESLETERHRERERVEERRGRVKRQCGREGEEVGGHAVAMQSNENIRIVLPPLIKHQI